MGSAFGISGPGFCVYVNSRGCDVSFLFLINLSVNTSKVGAQPGPHHSRPTHHSRHQHTRAPDGSGSAPTHDPPARSRPATIPHRAAIAGQEAHLRLSDPEIHRRLPREARATQASAQHCEPRETPYFPTPNCAYRQAVHEHAVRARRVREARDAVPLQMRAAPRSRPRPPCLSAQRGSVQQHSTVEGKVANGEGEWRRLAPHRASVHTSRRKYAHSLVQLPSPPPSHPVGYCASSCLGCSPEHSNCTSSEDQKTYGLLTLRIGTVNQPLVYATVGGTVSKSGGGGARADRGVSSVSSPGPAVNRSGDDARWLASGTGPAGTALFKARYRPRVDCV